MAHVKHARPHKQTRNPLRRNGKAWKKGLPPAQRVSGRG